MKKKILFLIHNPFVIENYVEFLKKLNEKYDITIISGNFNYNKNPEKKIEKIKKYIKLNNWFLIPFYSRASERNILSVFKSHLKLKYIKKKVDFEKFELCISGGKFFSWQRIILELFLNKKCLQIGIEPDPVLLNLEKFRSLLDGENINEIIDSVHKLRQIKTKKKIKTSLINKFENVIRRFNDIYLDRIFFSYLFHGKKMSYKNLDLKIFETDLFDYKITLFFSSYIFWSKIYQPDKLFLSKLNNNCVCDNNNKDKIIFLSTDRFWDKNIQILSKQLDYLVNFISLIQKENPDLKEVHFRHHPMETEEIKELINTVFSNKKGLKFKIEFVDNSVSLYNVACNYKIAFGAMTAALFYIKDACKNLKVYCLKSLSNEYGENYNLKFIKEDIIFYDDLNDKIDNYQFKKGDDYKNIKKINFIELTNRLLNQKNLN